MRGLSFGTVAEMSLELPAIQNIGTQTAARARIGMDDHNKIKGDNNYQSNDEGHVIW
jgi:hypothetical protein